MNKVLNASKSSSVITTVAALLFSVLSSVPASSAGVITEYAGVGDYPRGITVGPDGNLWVAGELNGEIVKVTTSGVSTKYGGFSREVLNNNPSPQDVTVGADGNIWFTKGYGLLNIGRISTSGTVTEFPSGMAHNTGIVALGDYVWYASSYYSKLGKMAMDGTKTTVDIPGAAYQLTVGPDKNIWAALTSRNSIVRVNVKTNETTEYVIPTAASRPYAITSGPDGNIWFTMLEHRIGKLEISSGTITEYELPTAGSGPRSIIAGADGNLYYTGFLVSKIGMITTEGVVTEFTGANAPFDIVSGPDGNVWFTATGNGGRVGKLTVDNSTAITVTTVSDGPGQVGDSVAIASGKSTTLHANPDANSVFIEWNCSDGFNSTSASATISPTADVTCTATFEATQEPQVELGLSVSPESKAGLPFTEDITISLTGGSGTGAVTYSIDPSSTATGCSLDSTSAPTTVSSTSPGTCVIKVTKAGDADYLEASDTVAFAFEKGNQSELTLGLSPASKVGAPFSSPVTTNLSGGSGTGQVTYSIDDSSTASGCTLNDSTNPTSISATSAGTCVVKATKSSDANYLDESTLSTFTFEKAEQSALQLRLSKKSKVGKPFSSEIGFEVTGGSGSGEVSYLIDPSSTATNCFLNMSTVPYTISAATAGTCVIKVQKAEDGEFQGAFDVETFTFQSKVFRTTFDVYFDKQSGDLNAAAMKMIRAKVLKIVSELSDSSIVRVYVRGRVQPTDFTFNDKALSLARAKNVSKAMKKLGLTGIYKIVGLGRSGLNLEKSRRARVTVSWTS